MIELERAVEAAGNLQPLRPSGVALVHLLTRPDWDIEQVLAVVEHDPVLMAKLLRLANSPLYGGRGRVSNVDAAVMRLGGAAVAALAIASQVRSNLYTRLDAYGLDEGALWRHSLAASLAIEPLRKHCRVSLPTESAVTALLHDIGKLAIAMCMEPLVARTLAKLRSERQLEWHQAESELFMFHHGQVGGLVVQAWGLPPEISRALTYHHAPDDAPLRGRETLGHVTRLADACASALDLPAQERKLSTYDRLGAAQHLGFAPEAFARVCQQVEEQLHEMAALMAA